MRSGFYKEGSLELKLLLVRYAIEDGNLGNRNKNERENGRHCMDIIDEAIKLIYIKGLKL
jgi:hypothetical protein|tara:strand:+ start:384 stop:563 length:180 start_codon:yes stop_codon:yes gene_type:complete